MGRPVDVLVRARAQERIFAAFGGEPSCFCRLPFGGSVLVFITVRDGTVLQLKRARLFFALRRPARFKAKKMAGDGSFRCVSCPLGSSGRLAENGRTELEESQLGREPGWKRERGWKTARLEESMVKREPGWKRESEVGREQG